MNIMKQLSRSMVLVYIFLALAACAGSSASKPTPDINSSSSDAQIGNPRLSLRVTGHLPDTSRSYSATENAEARRQTRSNTYIGSLDKISRIRQFVIDVLRSETQFKTERGGYHESRSRFRHPPVDILSSPDPGGNQILWVVRGR